MVVDTLELILQLKEKNWVVKQSDDLDLKPVILQSLWFQLEIILELNEKMELELFLKNME